nr:immunoglobulin heavy chain junction region [Mus musculus]NSM04816.1 immunoglobulin heavy chain junction region [Mus musculus]NSM05079.1 immunoglobulin heavy chain junction region [Mus musculus]NSM05091.1 immunoglobulin heavy chain junction region [Mus musculus]
CTSPQTLQATTSWFVYW